MRGATLADLPSRDALRTIAAPALILAWTGDPVHPASIAEELHGLLGDSRLHIASTRDELSTWTDRVARFVSEAA